jgi:hypothetical protein
MGILNEYVSTYVTRTKFGRWGTTSNLELYYDIAGTEEARITRNYSAAVLKFNRDVTTDMIIDGNGNVGIGTTAPATKFEMYGGNMALKMTGATTGSIQFKNSSGTKIQEIRYDDSDGSMTLGGIGSYPIKFITSTTEKVRIAGDGNVGIGTTSPDSKLKVFGTNVNDGSAYYTMNLLNTANAVSGVGSGLMFGTNIGTASGIYINAMSGIEGIKENGTNNDYASALKFTTRINGGSLTERVRIDSVGNVGIGTSSAAYKLQVSGSIAPVGDNKFPLGNTSNRFSDVFAAQSTIGGLFETGLRTTDLGLCETGTIVSWKVDKCVPCEIEEDELVMGVVKRGKDEPLILGAEPILVTGVVDVGDYIVTSKKKGHGKAIKRGTLFKKDLFGKVIAQALESGVGESYAIKAMIRKM